MTAMWSAAAIKDFAQMGTNEQNDGKDEDQGKSRGGAQLLADVIITEKIQFLDLHVLSPHLTRF